MAITATDTAPLCGTYPKKCIRRYGAHPLKNHLCHETGLRILIGYCVRRAATYGLGLEPVLAHYADHYFRIYFTVRDGANRADKALSQLGYYRMNKRPDPVIEISRSGSALPTFQEIEESASTYTVGPLWLPPLSSTKFLQQMKEALPSLKLGTATKIEKYLDLMLAENDLPPFFYDVNELASHFKKDPPRMATLLDKLTSEGYGASRTHFAPSGFRTDAPFSKISEIYGADQRSM